MFTGIIEATGRVENIEKEGTNILFTMSCPFTKELKIDQSISHDGCCLTVYDIDNQQYKIAAIHETLEKTNLGNWKIGTEVNLERCVLMNGRLDGHIVQGHVDQTGVVKSIENKNGSHLITIEHSENDGFVTVPQGSIAVNGISLTVAYSGENEFSVAIIPYTWEHTNLKHLSAGDRVNLEFDVIGKYIAKLIRRP
jgi:riboflavin synthase, alpha subunit